MGGLSCLQAGAGSSRSRGMVIKQLSYRLLSLSTAEVAGSSRDAVQRRGRGSFPEGPAAWRSPCEVGISGG